MPFQSTLDSEIMTARRILKIGTLAFFLTAVLVLVLLVPVFTLSAQAAVTTGTTAPMVGASQPIRDNSSAVAIFGFGATSTGGDTLNQVDVNFVSVTGFAMSDLKARSTNGAISGVAIYRDDGLNDDILDPSDTALTLSTIQNIGFSVRLSPNSESVPGSVTGSYQWFIVIRTSRTISNGDTFNATIAAGGIVMTGPTTQPATLKRTQNLVTTIAVAYDMVPTGKAYLSDPGFDYDTIAPLGFRVLDGDTNLDAFKQIVIHVQDVGQSDFTFNMLQPLSTTAATSGVALYRDTANISADGFDPYDDYAIDLLSIGRMTNNRVALNFSVTAPVTENVPDISLGGNVDYLIVLRTSMSLAHDVDIRVNLDKDMILVSGADGSDYGALAGAITGGTVVSDTVAPTLGGDVVSITSSSSYFYEADTDCSGGDDKVYYNDRPFEGNAQVVTIQLSGYVENNPDRLEGEMAFNYTVGFPYDETDSTTQSITYQIFTNGPVSNPLTVTMIDKVGHTGTYDVDFVADNTDPQFDSAGWVESSDYCWVGGGKLYFRDGMPTTEYAYATGTTSDAGADPSGLDRLEFSTEGSLASSPSSDNTPATFVGAYGIDYASNGLSSPATLTLYDMCGNRVTTDLDYQEDNTDPTVSITSPTNGATVSGSVVVQINAADNFGIDRVDVSFNGGTTWTQCGFDGSRYVMTWDTLIYSEGTYTVIARARDYVGNTVYDSIVARILNYPLSVSFISPSTNDAVAGTMSVAVDPSDYTVDCVLYIGVTTVGTDLTKDMNGYYTFNVDTLSFSDGYHILKAVVHGTGGNASSQIAILIDNTAPVIDSVTGVFPGSQRSAKSGDKVHIRAVVYDNASGMSQGEVTVSANSIGGGISMDMYDDGTHADLFTDDDVFGSEEITVTATWGYHVVTVFATDKAGNSAKLAYSFPVDDHAPFVNDVWTIYPTTQAAAKAGDMIRIAADVTELEEEVPIDIVFTLDNSGSMAGDAMTALKNATKTFVNKLGPTDHVALYCFDPDSTGSEGVKQLEPWTRTNASGKTKLVNSIDGLIAQCNTPIWDTIGAALTYAMSSYNRSVVIAFTDGADHGLNYYTWDGYLVGYEHGSEDFCPWHNWGTEVTYGNHVGNYTFNQDGQFHKNVTMAVDNDGAGTADDSKRWGLLNAPIPVYTIGLGGGILHQEPPYPGTPEEGLYDIGETSSGGKYYYAPSPGQLGDVYNTISTFISTMDAPMGIDRVIADARAVGGDKDLIMYDDGLHGDGLANDGVYATELFQMPETFTAKKTVYVRAYDKAGNMTEDEGETIVDNHIPNLHNITIVESVMREYAEDGDVIYFEANATDYGSDIYQVYVDATEIGSTSYMTLNNSGMGNDLNNTDTIYTSADLEVTTGMVTKKYFTVRFTVIDDAGNNRSQLSNFLVINDESLPICTIVSPSNTEFIEGTHLVQVSATDASGIENVTVYMQEMDGATPIGPLTSIGMSLNILNGYYEYYLDTTALSQGNYQMYAIAYDRVAKPRTSPVNSIWVDNDYPALFVTSPSSGDHLAGPVFVNASATDLAVGAITYSVDGAGSFDVATALDTRLYPDGTHIITITAVDKAGHATSIDVSVQFDNTAPDGIVSRPVPDEYASGIYQTTVSASDMVAIDDVRMTLYSYLTGSPVITDTNSVRMVPDTEGTGYIYLLNTLKYDDGPYMLSVLATDRAGNSATFEDRYFYINNGGPSLAVFEPLDGDPVNGFAYKINYSASATDLDSVSFSFDGKSWGDASVAINTSRYSDGQYDLTVRAVDKGGIYSEITRQVYIDNTKPTVRLLAPANNQVIDGEFEFKASIYDLGGVKEGQAFLYIDGNPYTLIRESGSDLWTVTINVDDLSNAKHTVYVDVTDNGGWIVKTSNSYFISSFLDTDGDGYPDDEDDYPNDPTEWWDTDGDGVGDNADQNDDGDEYYDDEDDFPRDPDEYIDTDGDGIGDNEDLDDDDDGILDINDALPLDDKDWLDYDLDGIGDSVDDDDDNDLVPDDRDAFPYDEYEHFDHDGDGKGNSVDLDDDGDGTPDEDDYYPLDGTRWEDPDRDGDGVENGQDAFPDNPYLSDNPIGWILLFLGLVIMGILIAFGATIRDKVMEMMGPKEEEEEEEEEEPKGFAAKKTEKKPKKRSWGRKEEEEEEEEEEKPKKRSWGKKKKDVEEEEEEKPKRSKFAKKTKKERGSKKKKRASSPFMRDDDYDDDY